MRSILRIRAEGGWLPRWALATGETNVMSGDPVTAFLSEGWSKGLLSGLEDEAWDAMWQNVNQKPDPTKLKGGQRIRGRDGNDTYTALGWIGYRTTSGYLYGDERKAGSATLEYALSDCALGGLAAALDKSNEAAVLRQRAQNYRNLWDASIGSKGFTGFPRARTSAGAWVGSTDPTVSTGFHEGTPWQYEWLVPQDVEGLFQVMGGRAEAARRLDEFFALDSVVADPYRAAHEQWVVGPYAYNNAWRYNPNNEPDLHVPWLYAWTGQAWKTSAVVRAAQTLFTNQPNGVTGNDDLGEMSAWYVFSALGLYPVMSGSATYVLNAPRFEHAVLTFENGNTLTLNAPGAAGGVQYIQGVRLDGQAFNRTWIDHTTLTGTSRTLDFDLAPGTPAAGDATWGSTVASQPVSLCGSDVTPPTTAASLAPAAVNGWYRNPTVTLTASDAGSGVDRSDYRLDGGAWTTYAAPFPVTGDGEHTLDYRSTDVAGNAETAQSLTFAVDATAPTITIATPAEGGSYLLGSNVSAAYRCADATSALDSCTGPVPDGQPLDTSTVGAHTFTVAARDRAGNERTQTVAYTVIFAFTGFFAPVANPATVNVVKAGSGIPVKFNLGGNQGLAIFAGGYPQSAPISCDPQSKTNTIAAKDTVKATTSSLSYDPKSKQYTYTWATGKNWANSCRQLWLKLTDNTTHAALFKFTR
jgi:hypothetical protein